MLLRLQNVPLTCSFALAVCLGTSQSASAGDHPLWATNIDASSTNCWIDESFAEGNPGCAPCPCNDGDYAVSQSGGCWLSATDLQTFSMPLGEQIVGLKMNVLGRYDNNVTGQVRMRVILNGQELAIRDSSTFTSDLQCKFRMGEAGDIFGLKSNWTGQDINNLQIGVRRINTPGETLRVKGLRIKVITAPLPPTLGACCLPNGNCLTTNASICANFGGVFHGIGSDCDDVSCPVSCDGASGSCCSPNGTPGCNNGSCCTAVCDIDPFCCEVEWDDLCVDTAGEVPACGCAPPPPSCPGSGGDCCQANGTPGCGNSTCCQVICNADPFCCDVEWDQLCADAAADIPACNCAPPGGCPGGGGDCCEPNGSPGCGNTACCDAICAVDSFCCEVEWDSLCADAAQANPACGCVQLEACCLQSGGCIMLSADQCAQLSGEPQGAGSTCSDQPCGPDADLDNDGQVGATDLAILLGQWGPCPGCSADLNGDGAVRSEDLALLLAAWN